MNSQDSIKLAEEIVDGRRSIYLLDCLQNPDSSAPTASCFPGSAPAPAERCYDRAQLMDILCKIPTLQLAERIPDLPADLSNADDKTSDE